MSRSSPSALISSFAFLATAAVMHGCGNTDVPVSQDAASGPVSGEVDAGTGACGAAACQVGALCCASADPSCTPTCMNVSTCPVYGRSCGVAEAGTASDASSSLHWFLTCGDPLCQTSEDAGVATDDAGTPCPGIGTTCDAKGATCGVRDPHVNCGAIEVCDDHDPRRLGCAVSSRKFKNDVSYLDDAALGRLHDETIGMRLATYAYKDGYGDPFERHLGFIIEDQPQSMSVDRGHDRVDMYGYLSMVVATMQVQEKEIAELKAQLAARSGGAKARARK